MPKLADTFPLFESKILSILSTRLLYEIREYNSNLAPANQTIPENIDVIVGSPAAQYIETQISNQPIINVFMRSASTVYFDGVDQYGLTATYSVIAILQDSTRGLASSWHIARWLAQTSVDILNTYAPDSPGDIGGFVVRVDPTTLSQHSFGNNQTGAIAEYQITADLRSAYEYNPAKHRDEIATYATRQQWITSDLAFDPSGPNEEEFTILPTQQWVVATDDIEYGLLVTPTTGAANTTSAAWTPSFFGYLSPVVSGNGFFYDFSELGTLWDDPLTTEIPVHFLIEDTVQQRRTYFTVIFVKEV